MAIYCKASDIGDTFYDEIYNTMESRLIAEDKESGIQVLLYDDTGYPKILVTCDGYPIDAIGVYEPGDIKSQVEEVYRTYIDDEGLCGNAKAFEEAKEDCIRERQRELEDATVDYLSAILEVNILQTEKEYGDVIPELLDHVLEYLFREHGIDPYRPMVLVDENDEEFYEEYPYSCMEFDD